VNKEGKSVTLSAQWNLIVCFLRVVFAIKDMQALRQRYADFV